MRLSFDRNVNTEVHVLSCKWKTIDFLKITAILEERKQNTIKLTILPPIEPRKPLCGQIIDFITGKNYLLHRLRKLQALEAQPQWQWPRVPIIRALPICMG